MYLDEHIDWTRFTWDDSLVLPRLTAAHAAQGKVLGFAHALGFRLRETIGLEVTSDEIVASSQIEGIHLDSAKVRSSVSRQLGIKYANLISDTHEVDGAVSVMLDAVEHYNDVVTKERLFAWHRAMFSTELSRFHPITIGAYRTESMQVVSGAIGHERIHFQAIDAIAVPEAMDEFLSWINSEVEVDSKVADPIMKAAIAHLWFLTIHPFDDGNGRIARALTELLLSRSDSSPHRYNSLAAFILKNRKSYYEILEQTQKGTSEITAWLVWFFDALCASMEDSLTIMQAALSNEAFWTSISSVELNQRQRKMLFKLRGSFKGKLTAAKWAKMCKVSHDTALRDINDLIQKNILIKDSSGGRSTSYTLVF